eukprot:jgi/Chlat1/1123/Chrsp111S01603
MAAVMVMKVRVSCLAGMLMLVLAFCFCTLPSADADNYGYNGKWGNQTAVSRRLIEHANRQGPFVAIVAPAESDLQYLLDNALVLNSNIPFIDFAGTRFHLVKVSGNPVVAVALGLAMTNTALTVQALLDNFAVKYVVLYGFAGGVEPQYNVGDVLVASRWLHSGLVVWQRFGDSVKTPLPLEGTGVQSRKYGYLQFNHYNIKGVRNRLNRIWHQAEQFYQQGTGKGENPPAGVANFYYNVDRHLRQVAAEVAENVKLDRCVDEQQETGCVLNQPKAYASGEITGATANIFVDNAAFRKYLFKQFGAGLTDEETWSALFVCSTNNVPFIGFRTITNLAGGAGTADNINDLIIIAYCNVVRLIAAVVDKA